MHTHAKNLRLMTISLTKQYELSKPKQLLKVLLRKKQKKPRKARTSFATVERPDDLPEQLWQDWLELRKAKRAPLNTTTINTFRAEAQKAGSSFEEAVSFSVANGYQGFKADWNRKNASTFTNGRPHQGYAGFGARNTAEIDYTAGID